jgi:hypothetical protein
MFFVFFINDQGSPILTPVRAMCFPDETILPKRNLPYVEAV